MGAVGDLEEEMLVEVVQQEEGLVGSRYTQPRLMALGLSCLHSTCRNCYPNPTPYLTPTGTLRWFSS